MSPAEPQAGRHQAPRPQDLPEIPTGPALLVVLSAPSAAGKDAVRDLLISWGLPAHFAVTATSRPMRQGEIEGVDYIFLSVEEFESRLRQGDFLEHAVVYGQHKGVPRSEITSYLEKGQDVIARVDVQGAASLRRLFPDALLIFLAPPSLAELERRLDVRDSDSEVDKRLRLATAASELAAAKDFDHVVVNQTGGLEAAAREIVKLIAEAKRKRVSQGGWSQDRIGRENDKSR